MSHALVTNIRDMLRPMGWVAMYFGHDANKWNEFFDGIEHLDPRDIEDMYLTVLLLTQEEWKPVWNVWKLPRMKSPDTVHEVWMNYRSLGIKGRVEQQMLRDVLDPFKQKLKRLIAQWSLPPKSETPS